MIISLKFYKKDFKDSVYATSELSGFLNSWDTVALIIYKNYSFALTSPYSILCETSIIYSSVY